MRIARALCLLVLTAAAQDQPQTVIRTTTRLVQVRVVAEDAQGRPVTGLQKDDFQLEDNRKRQPIALFAAQGEKLTGAQAAADSESQQESAMILLDWLNPRFTDRLMVRDKVNQLLRNFHPRQRVGLYLLAHEPRLLRDFTDDPNELIERLAETDDDPPTEEDLQAEGKFDARYSGAAAPRRLGVEEKIFEFNIKVQNTLHTLDHIADRLARVRGHKSLIWVTNGFPVLLDGSAVPGARGIQVSYTQDVERILNKLNRADVAVHMVDARGLTITARGYPDTLQDFAARTGGSLFKDRNDLDEGMRLALEDDRVSYILAFNVPAGAAPGMHELRVHTTRPGVRLRYRESYQLDDGR